MKNEIDMCIYTSVFLCENVANEVGLIVVGLCIVVIHSIYEDIYLSIDSIILSLLVSQSSLT